MGTGAGKSGIAPVFEQCPHLRLLQSPARPHRAVAGHRREHGIVPLLHGRRRGPLLPVLHHRPQQRLRIALRHQRRHRPDDDGPLPELLDLEAEPAQILQMRAHRHDLPCGQFHHLGKQRMLRRDGAGVKLGRQTLEQHALVRRVLIHDLHLVTDLREQVAVGDLAHRPHFETHGGQIRLRGLRGGFDERRGEVEGAGGRTKRCGMNRGSLRRHPSGCRSKTRRDRRRPHHRLNARADPFMHPLLVGKTHLALRRMDVHVHMPGIHRQRQHKAGVASLRQIGAVAFIHGMRNRGAFHPAAIHKQVLRSPRPRRRQRPADEPFQMQRAVLLVHRRAGIHQRLSIDLLHPLPQGPHGGIVRHRMPIVRQPEVDRGKRQRLPLDGLADVSEFRRGALEKLLPGRGVVEQVGDVDRRPRRRRGVPLFHQRAPVQTDLRAHRHTGRDGDDPNFRNRRDAGQGFAAEAHRLNGKEIGLRADLARRVTMKRQGRLVRSHAAAVIGHPDEAPPGLLDVDRHAGGPGVDGVFHQFLHHGRRTFDDFAGRDPVDHITGKNRDFRCHLRSASFSRARLASFDCGYFSITCLRRSRALATSPSSACARPASNKTAGALSLFG